MKIPEFIPFKFGKFECNLQRKMGAAGVGRWALLRKAVGETPTLTIDITDIIDREALELDMDCTPDELTEFLEYASDRKAINQELYHQGTIWIEGLGDDLAPFFRAGKRPIPICPDNSRKIPRLDPQVTENSETSPQVVENSESSSTSDRISAHERTNEQNERTDEHRNERTNESGRERISITKEIAEWCEVYGSTGNRYETEAAYLEAWRMLQSEGVPPKMAHEMLKNAAAKDRAFCLATQRRRKDPHSWLKKRDWVRDYDQELKEHKEQESTKTAKGGLQNNGTSTARAYTDAARKFVNDIESQLVD